MTTLGLEGGAHRTSAVTARTCRVPIRTLYAMYFTMDTGRDLVVRPINTDGTGHVVATTLLRVLDQGSEGHHGTTLFRY